MNIKNLNTHEALADLALIEPALAAAEGDVVHLLVAAVEARLAVRAARRRSRARQRRALHLTIHVLLSQMQTLSR